MEEVDQVHEDQEQNHHLHQQQHQCKLCNKSFANGKVLGGHMRSHRSRNIPAKKRKKNSIAAAYSLRENPKKSWKFSSAPTTIPQTLENLCKICGKSFDSSKALFGHMRHHSGKRKQSIKDLELPPKRKRSTRSWCKLGISSNSSNSSCCSDDFVQISSDSGIVEPDVHDLALILLMLSNNGVEFGVMPKHDDDDESEMGFGENGKKSLKKCGIGDSFVGVCEEEEEEQEIGNYECDVCLKVFGSGRALGGHKRAHVLKPNLMEIEQDQEIVVHNDHDHDDVERFKPWWNNGDDYDDDNGGLVSSN